MSSRSEPNFAAPAKIRAGRRVVDEQWIAMVALAIMAVAVFMPGLGGEMLIWDDDINLLSTPHVRQVDSESLRWMFSDTAQALRYKPLSWLVWATLHEFFEVGNAPYKIVNLSLHVANTALVFALLVRLIGNFSAGERRRVCYAAAVATAFWALHPMRIEPVTWISGLGYPLALFFGLCSLSTLTAALSVAGRTRHRTVLISVSVALWILALFSYPSALCLTPAFPLAAIAFARHGTRRTTIWTVVPHLALSGGLAVLSTIARAANPGRWQAAAWDTVPVGEQLARLVSLPLWALIRLFPFSQNSPVHDGSLNPELSDSFVILAVTVIVGTTIGLFLVRRHSWIPFAAWLAFLIALIPHAGLDESTFLPAERYTYTAALFFTAALGIGLAQLPLRWAAGCLLTTFAIGISTHLHADLWRTNIGFFEHSRSLAATPEYRSMLAGRLGMGLMAADRSTEAIGPLEEGLRFDQNNASLWLMLVEAYDANNQPERSAEAAQKILQLDPPNLVAANNLGIAFVRLGRTREAVSVLEQVRAKKPSSVTDTNLAYALEADGRPEEALQILSDNLQDSWAPAAELAQRLQTTLAPSEATKVDRQ